MKDIRAFIEKQKNQRIKVENNGYEVVLSPPCGSEGFELMGDLEKMTPKGEGDEDAAIDRMMDFLKKWIPKMVVEPDVSDEDKLIAVNAIGITKIMEAIAGTAEKAMGVPASKRADLPFRDREERRPEEARAVDSGNGRVVASLPASATS